MSNILRNRGSSSLPSHGDAGHGYDVGYGGYNAGGGGGGGGGNPYGGYNSGAQSLYGAGTLSSKSKRRGSRSHNFATIYMNPILWMIVAFLMFVLALYYRSTANGYLRRLSSRTIVEAVEKLKHSEDEARRWRAMVDETSRELQRKFTQQITTLEKENRFLQKERDELRVKHEGPDKKEEEARILQREVAWQSQVALLQKATQRESKRMVLEKYV